MLVWLRSCHDGNDHVGVVMSVRSRACCCDCDHVGVVMACYCGGKHVSVGKCMSLWWGSCQCSYMDVTVVVIMSMLSCTCHCGSENVGIAKFMSLW